MCAIVGVYNSKEAAKIAYYALFSMQHRGQESSGISVSNGDDITTIKKMGLISEAIKEQDLRSLVGNMAIGHNRYSTAGKKSVLDAQPIFANYELGQISIAHNGNLINKDEIRAKLIKEGAIFQSFMDTENIIHLIARSQQNSLHERIIQALNEIKGAYSLVIQSRSKMFAIRDKYGIRPLSLGKLEGGGYIVSSETCAFDLVGATFIRDIKPGEMLVFSKDCIKSFQLHEPEPRICAFEYIYFARPDSVIEGKNVYETRKKMGAALARQSYTKADIVMPVPDSGVAAALGYAKESKIPFEQALVRNHYVGRTFIEPTQALRNLKVKLKLSPIHESIKGKVVIAIDDSIVRGTTSKQIVSMLKNAGAKEVHMKIAAPPIKHPNCYGIDTPSYKELISANNTNEQIRAYIGADSLSFLSIESLVQAIGNERKYALESFDGDYFVK